MKVTHLGITEANKPMKGRLNRFKIELFSKVLFENCFKLVPLFPL